MNKKFVEFCNGYGLTVQGNSAYGTMNGYETNVKLVTLDNVSPLRIHISFYATDAQKQTIGAAIRNMAIKFFQMQFTPYGLMLGFNDMTLGALLKRLPTVLNGIFAVLSENGATTKEICPVCGNPLDMENAKQCNVDGFTITIDNACVNTINTVISAENKDFEEAPNNYFKGFCGAFIGGLVGVAISVLFYIAGFVSSISAIVSIVLGAFLYQKFHGKPNKVMIVIVTLTTFVLLAGTVPAIYIVAAGILANEAGVSMSAIEAFKLLMQGEPEFSRMFYADLGLIVLFTAIGSAFQIFVLSKKIKRKKNI